MKKILIAFALATLFLAGCASATDSKPTITITLTGAGTYAVNTTAKVTANVTYSGTGTLTYNWSINGTATTQHTQTTYYSATFATSQIISVVVTDGSSSGTASVTVVYQ